MNARIVQTIPEEPEGAGAVEPAVPPRERILRAAGELFYRHGIHAVGVDAVAEKAQSNKMTLYRHFASKDLLVAEYLRGLAVAAENGWNRLALAFPGDAPAQLDFWVAHVLEGLANCQGRGCPLANAAIELPNHDHPARAVIEEHKRHERDHLVLLCQQAGLADSEQVADEIFLLLEGAQVSLQSVGREGPVARLGGMIRDIITAHRQSAD